MVTFRGPFFLLALLLLLVSVGQDRVSTPHPSHDLYFVFC